MKIVLHLATVVCVLMAQTSGRRFKRSSGSSGSSEESGSPCPAGPVPTDEQCQILETAFTNQDLNGDGQLTLAEFQQLFSWTDFDGNGLLSFNEFGFANTFLDGNAKVFQFLLWELTPQTEISRQDLPQIFANHNVCDECTCGITLEEYKTYYLQNGIFEVQLGGGGGGGGGR